ncbi:MAG TPA: hypothetical protein VGA50_04550 [Kiloniellales bacterium]
MRARVIKAFTGKADYEVHPRKFRVGEAIKGPLAEEKVKSGEAVQVSGVRDQDSRREDPIERAEDAWALPGDDPVEDA